MLLVFPMSSQSPMQASKRDTTYLHWNTYCCPWKQAVSRRTVKVSLCRTWQPLCADVSGFLSGTIVYLWLMSVYPHHNVFSHHSRPQHCPAWPLCGRQKDGGHVEVEDVCAFVYSVLSGMRVNVWCGVNAGQ